MGVCRGVKVGVGVGVGVGVKNGDLRGSAETAEGRRLKAEG